MTIRINDTPIDFTLEHEKTFADLYTSLARWAETQKLDLLSVLGDGKDMAHDSPVALETLDVIEVEAIPVSEAAMARLAVLAKFFAHAAQGAGGEEWRSQYREIRDLIPKLLAPVAHRIGDSLEALDAWSQEAPAAAARLVSEAASLHRELADPMAALNEALDHLDRVLPGDELATLFQKGQDRDGFARILTLFTAFEDLSRRGDLALESAAAETSTWTAFQDELRPFLGEARDALEAGDHILLTDLLEYEIVPRLASIRACFSILDPAAGQP